jgi:ProP effector
MTEPTEDKRDPKLEEKRRRAAEARDFLTRLSERYPACFTRDRDKIHPLAIGIQQKLRAELSAEPEWQETPGWLVRQALAIYTRSPAYLHATVEKRPRINLDGSVAGEVTEQEQEHARTRLEEIKARREARQPSKKRPNRRPPPKRESQEDRTRRKLEQLAAKFSK